MTRRWRGGAVGLALAAVLAGGLTAADASPAAGPLILADTNRDGVVDAKDAEGRGTWTKDRGALFLANLDDDSERCPSVAEDGSQLSDVELASCFDAADRKVNGDADVKDLARVQVMGAKDADAVRVELRGVGATKVNVFVRRGPGTQATDWQLLPANGRLAADQLRDGVELGVEGKDIIRDDSWDGTVVIRAVHTKNTRVVATDQVQMRVAPLLFVTDRMPIERLYMADNETSVYQGNEVPEPSAGLVRTQKNAENLASDFQRGLERIGGDVKLEKLPSLQGARGGGNGTDIWTQDVMEPGLMSIPSPEGEQQMRVFVRAPVRDGRDNSGVNPFRQTGRVVFTELRGPDVAGIQHFDPDYEPAAIPGQSYDTRGSTGNYGTLPSYEHKGEKFPLGRKVLGAVPGTGFTADPAFNEMLELQGFQDPITVDTSWLSVGHIDEFMSVVPADNERGWALVLADPQLALNLLKELVEDGRGDERLYTPYGLVPPEGSNPPATTVAETVSDPMIRSGVKIGAAGVDKALRVLKAETGITESDIIRVPVMYRDRGTGRVGVTVPNAANLIGTGHEVVFIPTQHVPALDGEDLFQQEIEKRFAEVGTEVQWAEDYFYTSRSGQIHCVTNVLRDTTFGDSWWTEGEERAPEAPKEFSIVSQPSVSGKLAAGQTITARPAGLSPAATKVAYQWYVGGKAVKGATSKSLKLKSSWAGKKIRVGIVHSSAGVKNLTTFTDIGALPKSFTRKSKPKVTGSLKVGKTLKATAGSMSPKPSSVSYRWYVGGKAIKGKGSTKPRLKLKKSMAGKKVSVVVTSTKRGYTTEKVKVVVAKGAKVRR